MLNRLTIKNFVIVKNLDLSIHQGFTVLTGETGAGKSILLDALGLLLGNRADSNVVAQHADKADLSAEFISNRNIDLWLSERELNGENHQILTRRIIDAQGKSRAFINGIAVTIMQLRELGEQLVHIHGQHAHQQLLKPAAQRNLLDAHAQLNEQRNEVQSAFQTWQNTKNHLDTAVSNAEQLNDQLSTLSWKLDGVNELSPQEGEWEILSAEHIRLSHAATLIQGSASAVDELNEKDDAISNLIQTQINHLSSLSLIDEQLKEPIELLDHALINLQEAAHFLNNYVQRNDSSDTSFTQLDERISLWMEQTRKLRTTPENLHNHWLELQNEMQSLQENFDVEQLRGQEQQHFKTFKNLAEILSKARTNAANQLSQDVTERMQKLNMIDGQFHININEAEPSAHGIDQIGFLVAGHSGVSLQPLNKVASGGELARISLAISVITSLANPTPTLIFDEVDSGIGGAVAEVVGELLAQLGQTRQVLCVTHLAQVAAKAHQHWCISKNSKNNEIQSSIQILPPDERIDEVARMLGGIEITQVTRNHANELLAQKPVF